MTRPGPPGCPTALTGSLSPRSARHAFAPLNLHAGASLRNLQTGHGRRSPRTLRLARARSACHGEYLAAALGSIQLRAATSGTGGNPPGRREFVPSKVPRAGRAASRSPRRRPSQPPPGVRPPKPLQKSSPTGGGSPCRPRGRSPRRFHAPPFSARLGRRLVSPSPFWRPQTRSTRPAPAWAPGPRKKSRSREEKAIPTGQASQAVFAASRDG